MTISRKNFFVISSCLMMVTSMTFVVPVAHGETSLAVSGNGESSANTVDTSSNNSTNVNSNNNANVTNNINVKAETGNNTANNNVGGNSTIKTGDAKASTNVTTAANQSQVQTNNCCQGGASAQVNGNGSHSNNSVSYATNQNTNVNVNQNANIYNNLYQDLSTGNNRANGNVGNVSIKTGDSNSSMRVTNAPVNVSKVKASNSLEEFLAKISENGYGSYNNINAEHNNNQNIIINNDANVINDLVAKFETGNNKANDNVGDVDIQTGDVASDIGVNNSVNVSEVETGCGCNKEKAEKPHEVEKTTPPSQTSAGNGGDTTTHNNEQKGPQLPITGNNWLILALFGNIMMLLLGAYLRLRSGRSPGFVAN